jgi:hypothetical protein
MGGGVRGPDFVLLRKLRKPLDTYLGALKPVCGHPCPVVWPWLEPLCLPLTPTLVLLLTSNI